ncbi:MAG: carboxypeptidase-like regulatory domain-containing protein, partial [Planctomycetota bacterium]
RMPRTLRFEGTRHLALSEPVAIEAGKTSSIELEARAGVVLVGSVRDDAGKPVAEAHVSLQDLSDWSTTSAADGSFRLVVDPGPCVLWVHAQGYQQQTLDLGSLVFDEQPHRIEVLLPRGGFVAGRVQWPDGSPARNALISISLQRNLFGGNNGVDFSAEDGSFEVTGLGEGPLRLFARAQPQPLGPGTKRALGESGSEVGVAEILDVPADARDLLVVLSMGHEITGIVRAEGPAPLLGFQLAAHRQTSGFDPNERPLEKSFEGAGGRFSMGGFLPGDWELACRASGFAEGSVRFTVPSTTPIELVLTPGAVLSGRVLDERGGPVRARVALDDGRFSAFYAHRTDELVTGPDGAFAFTELRAGSHELTVEKPGFVALEEDVEILAGEVRSDHDVILRRGSTIEGRVLGIDGQPSPQAYVHLYGTGQGFPPGARAGPNGNFRFDGVPPGDLRLEVALADGLRFESRVHVDPAATVRVELSPPRTGWVTLAGRATVAGKPSPGLQLSARVLGEREASSSGESDSTGSFRLVLPGPGTYRLDLEDFDGTFSWSEDLVVPPVEEFPHDIEAPAATIRGRVTTRDGVSLRNIRVQAESGDGSMDYSCSGDTDERGLYEFLVAPGRWSVFAGGPSTSSDDPHGFARARRDGLLLRAGETLEDVDLVLAPGASLSVRLARADGAPVGAAVAEVVPTGAVEPE